MRIRRLIEIGCLELFALLLANWQALGGVRTDEAKYLLNIPYPHPPLMRFVFSLTEGLPFQEMFWRIVLASVLVNGIWFVWDMFRESRLEDRASACVAWLLASAVLVQAGAIMLSSVAAIQALAWLWLRRRPELVQKYPLFVAMFWLATLFSSFQGVLLLPLAWSAFRRGKYSRSMSAAYVLAPLVLLGLWAMSNPLALATILIHKDQGVMLTITDRLVGYGKLWIVGGGLIGSIFGTWGLLRTTDRMLQLSFVLLSAYVLTSIPHPYYAIFFTPLFIGGLHELFRAKRHPHGFPLLAALVAGSALVTWWSRPPTEMSTARLTMEQVEKFHPDAKAMMINGSFGHEWQYETSATVRRYSPEFAAGSDVIICIKDCLPMFPTDGWKILADAPVQTWVRR
jgi:hypothetical protein